MPPTVAAAAAAAAAARRLSTATAAATSTPPLAALVPRVFDAAAPAPLPTRDANALSLRALMAANLHLGHNVELWNPRMLPFIHGVRHGTHIINLEHTLAAMRRAAAFVRQVALAGGNIVFLGTKPSLHKIVVDAAEFADAYYVLHWIGGTITNRERVLRYSSGFDPARVLQQMKSAASSLDASDAHADPSSRSSHPSSDHFSQDDPASDLASSLPSGIRTQPYVHKPDLIIALDYINNLWAVREANQALVPVIAVCDTNTDPTLIQYPIPANDDSIAGLKLIAGVLARAAADGSAQRKRELRNMA